MTWIKANPFLTGFFAVMAIGVGVLGWLLMSARGAFTEASDRYTTQATELTRLRRLPLFPNAKNLSALDAQKTEAAQAITAFQADLAKREFPLEQMTPEQFQQKLKASVSAVRARAASAGIVLPKDKFFLGFDVYEGRPPDPAAATPLGRQLKAIEWVVNELITHQITELRSLSRTELPEEKSRVAAPAGAAARGASPAKPLVQKYPFQVTVFSSQRSVSNALNSIVGPKAPQFYIPRVVRIKNENDKGPKRIRPDAATLPAPVPETAPPGGLAPAAPAQISSYIAGNERVETFLRLEIVDFSEVEAK